MNQPLTKVYFVPGMAAGPEIFERIHLPEDSYEVEILEWLIPEQDESLEDYSKRMAARVKQPNCILVGVSFGGVVVQEMKAFLPEAQVVIISSVKSKAELPKRFMYARLSKLYRVLPTSLVVKSGDFTRFAIGPRTKKRLALYNTYLSVRDKRYLDWAIREMICWDRAEADPQVKHIHGDRDIVFPIKNIENALPIAGGTHAMIIYKAKTVSDALIKLLNEA